MTDILHLIAGQRISVTCNSFDFGLGTVAHTVVVEALVVGTAHRAHHGPNGPS
jgi:hypothetical protein